MSRQLSPSTVSEQQVAIEAAQAAQVPISEQPAIAYEPDLVPPLELMRQEGIDILEEWFRWAEEWSVLLRIYGELGRDSKVLEIGCGLGRIAFALRYNLSPNGSYDGFEICRPKVDFLEQTFHKAYPNFHFTWADVHNTYYNPEGRARAADYSFPYRTGSFDLVFAASVFTHMLPDAAARYFTEAARVLQLDGRCVFSFFLLDNYRPGQPRPFSFGQPAFNFDLRYDDEGDDFAIVERHNPEQMTAYRLSLVERIAARAGLELAQPALQGLWSGTSRGWIGTQDLVVLQKKR